MKRCSAARFLAPGLCALTLGAMLGLASCASIPYTPSEKKVDKLVALIDQGGVGAIKVLASTPFILDAEILLRQADVDAAWTNLKAAGFTLGRPTIASIARIGADTYTTFGDSMDVRVFFKKYLDKNSVLVALDTSDGRYYLILNREIKGYPRIQGFKGPVK